MARYTRQWVTDQIVNAFHMLDVLHPGDYAEKVYMLMSYLAENFQYHISSGPNGANIFHI